MKIIKDSGIEWIGQIPEDWETTKIKYVVTPIKSGGTPDSDNDRFYAEEGIPWVAISDMSTSSYVFDTEKHITEEGRKSKNLLIFPTGTLLYSIYATVGKVSQLKIPACINQAILALIPHEDIYLTAFLKYNLKAIEDYVYSQSSGNTQFNLNAHKVNNFSIVSPNFETQKRIADFLDEKCGKIDRYIEKQQQVIEKLKAYKQSVITEAVTRGLNPDVPMKDSGITYVGEIPSHWRVIRFKYITDAIGDGLHGTPEYDPDGEYYFLNGNNIGNENLVFKDNTDRLSESEYTKYKPININENTILITLNGATYGKTSFYNNEKVLLGKSAGYITLKDGENKYFVRLYLQSHIARVVMELSLCGSTIANLSLKTLNEFVMPYPPCDEQEQIVEYLTARCFEIDRVIDKKQSLIDKLTEYKKSLIYEAVTGKLEV